MKILQAIFLSCVIFLLVPKELEAKDGFLVHLSSKDPHRVSMALSIALKMTTENDVFVFVDIDGVYPMLKDYENIEYKNFEPVRTMIEKLLKAGVEVAICPMCLEAAGYTKYQLLDGLKIAEKKDFFDFTNERIITLDY